MPYIIQLAKVYFTQRVGFPFRYSATYENKKALSAESKQGFFFYDDRISVPLNIQEGVYLIQHVFQVHTGFGVGRVAYPPLHLRFDKTKIAAHQ